MKQKVVRIASTRRVESLLQSIVTWEQLHVKKMLVQQARSVYWKKWAAKHEYQELKEGIWLELALALLRKKTKEEWTDKHRNTARKLVLEGGGVQKRLLDTGWSDSSECQACHKEEGAEKQRLYHCPKWYELRRWMPEAFRKWEQKREPQRRSGNGKEVSSRILLVKANGTEAISV